MRDWWLRTLLVLQRPRPVFVALRDESREDVGDRAEPILLVIWLAGIAVILFGLGAYFDTVGANFQQGSAYVFVRQGTTW